MSMTRERAAEWFETHMPTGGVKPVQKQAYLMALSALRPVSREQVEKVWRGEWKPTESPYMNECEDCSVCGYRTPWGHGFRFCPACGAAQTDEAVQMVMERMEALKDGNVE